MDGYLRVFEEGNILKSKIFWGVLQDYYFTFFPDKKYRDPEFVINLMGCTVIPRFDENYNLNMIEVINARGAHTLLTPNEAKDFDRWANVLKNTVEKYNGEYGTNTSQSAIMKGRRSSGMSSNHQNSETMPVPKPRHTINRDQPDGYYKQEMQPNYNRSTPRGSVQSSTQYPITPDHAKSQYAVQQRPKDSHRPSVNSVQYRGSRPSIDSTNDRRPSRTRGRDSRRSHNPEDRRQSRQSHISYDQRPINTVKEDPDMADEDVLETRSIDHLRKRYPIPEAIKRYSIAATDLVGKSNEELYIMLIQMNRGKASMDVWKEHLEESIARIDEELEGNLTPRDRAQQDQERAGLAQDLDEMENMLVVHLPLINFLESVVQMSDIYAGDNQTFHVVYHDEPATGEENLGGLDSMRHNQERQVARMLDDTRSDGRDRPLRTGTMASTGSGLNNMPHSESYVQQSRRLHGVLDDMETEMLQLDQLKLGLTNYSGQLGLGRAGPLDPSTTHQSASLPSVQAPIAVRGSKVSDLKIIGGDETSAFKPRRSTRKNPKSDMSASLSRKAYYKHTNVPLTSFNGTLPPNFNAGVSASAHNSLRRPPSMRASLYSASPVMPTYAIPSHQQPQSQQSVRSLRSEDSGNKFKESFGHSSSSKVQNQLRNLMRTEPYADDNQARTSVVSDVSRAGGPPSLDVLNRQEPLLKIDVGKYNSGRRSREPPPTPPIRQVFSDHNTNGDLSHNHHEPSNTNYNVLDDDDVSVTESDVSLANARHMQRQRLNLNECVEDGKSWRNPSPARTPRSTHQRPQPVQ